MAPAIALADLRFAWAGSGPVLDIEALSVEPGERVFLHGASGSGKSTLLALVAGIVTPQAGRVEVLGTDLTRLRGPARDRFRADHVGFIFQMFNLLPYLSVIENATLACGFSPRRRSRVTGDAATESRRLLAHLGLGEDVLLRRSVSQLSVGQQQRVAAARALLGRPEIVIADEPTSALDADARGAFIDLLMRECEAAGAALMLVSHDISLSSHFDRTVSLPDINRATGAAAS